MLGSVVIDRPSHRLALHCIAWRSICVVKEAGHCRANGDGNDVDLPGGSGSGPGPGPVIVNSTLSMRNDQSPESVSTRDEHWKCHEGKQEGACEVRWREAAIDGRQSFVHAVIVRQMAREPISSRHRAVSLMTIPSMMYVSVHVVGDRLHQAIARGSLPLAVDLNRYPAAVLK